MKGTTPIHAGPHPIQQLAPSLRRLAQAEGGMPLFADAQGEPKHRVKLFPPYELRDPTGTLKFADLRRDTYRERPNLLFLVGTSPTTPHEWEVEIASTEALASCMTDDPELAHPAVVRVAPPGAAFTSTKLRRRRK